MSKTKIYSDIVSKQNRKIASKPICRVDYVNKLSDNLYSGGLAIKKVESFFSTGKGQEMEDHGGPAKMKASISSSALCVNTFCPLYSDFEVSGTSFEINNPKAVIKALNIDEQLITSSKYQLRFEEQKQSKTKRFPANLDVAIISEEKKSIDVFIESKFTEPYNAHGLRKNILKESYLDNDKKNIDPKFFNYGDISLINLKKYLDNRDEWEYGEYDGNHRCLINNSFNYLDIAQLIKHIFGIMNDNYENDRRNPVGLVYLYYDVNGVQKEELKKFQKVIEGDPIYFSHISYQDFIVAMHKAGILNEEHYSYLKTRYLD